MKEGYPRNIVPGNEKEGYIWRMAQQRERENKISKKEKEEQIQDI